MQGRPRDLRVTMEISLAVLGVAYLHRRVKTLRLSLLRFVDSNFPGIDLPWNVHPPQVLYTCVYIYIYVHTHVLCIYIYIYVYTHMHMYIYIYTYIHTYIHTCIHYINVYIHFSLSLSLYIYIYTHVYLTSLTRKRIPDSLLSRGMPARPKMAS